MKRGMILSQPYSNARDIDLRWLDVAEPEKIDTTRPEMFERVVWGLVWFLALLVVTTAVLGGTAILKGLS